MGKRDLRWPVCSLEYLSEYKYCTYTQDALECPATSFPLISQMIPVHLSKKKVTQMFQTTVHITLMNIFLNKFAFDQSANLRK